MRVFKQAAAGSGKRPFFYRDAGTLEIRSGRGDRLALFGFLFLLAGLFVMALPTGIIPITKRPEGLLTFSLMVLFGSALVVAGVVQVFGTQRARSGPQPGTNHEVVRPPRAHEARGNHARRDPAGGDGLVPRRQRLRRHVAREAHRRGHPETHHRRADPRALPRRGRWPRNLSRFLQKPLVDSLTGERVTRDPEHLDESYRDRMRRTGETAAPCRLEPPGMCTRVERTSEGLILHIPGPSLISGFTYIPALSPLAGGGDRGLVFLSSLPTLRCPTGIRYFFLGFIGLFFVAGPVVSALLNVLRLKNQFERITVTKAFLRVETLNRGSHHRRDPRRRDGGRRSAHVRSAMDTIECPRDEESNPGNTGTPRMPDGGARAPIYPVADDGGLPGRSLPAATRSSSNLQPGSTKRSRPTFLP